MSHKRSLPRHRIVPAVSRALRQCCLGTVERVRALGFWLAVALPWLLVALLLGGYIGHSPALGATLVASTGLCGFVGRDHAR